jgi:hypothetical protein
MKPKLFIGSSSESLDVAYAVQENLEHVAEVTVWTQGLFDLSNYTLDSLLDALDTAHFGLFVFAPDDVTTVRGTAASTVRDNVVFELGLFVGRLGRERNFLLIPKGQEKTFRLPTDLLGLTPALYDAERQDQNLQAALGPACSKISRAIGKIGPLKHLPKESEFQETEEQIVYSEEDKKAVLASWMGSRTSGENRQVIHFAEVDKQLRLEPGTTKKHIAEIATRWRYVVEHRGEHTILFKQEPVQRRISRNWNL